MNFVAVFFAALEIPPVKLAIFLFYSRCLLLFDEFTGAAVGGVL